MAKFGFDVAEVDITAGAGNYDPVPENNYILKALEAEQKDTSTGGEMIKVKFEVVSGDYKGRWIWQNFNIVNKSEIAQRIGRQQLVSWATACNKPDCDDTDKLIDKPFTASVSIKPASGQYKASNEIKSFLLSNDPFAPAAAKPAAAGGKPAPGAAKPANPWD